MNNPVLVAEKNNAIAAAQRKLSSANAAVAKAEGLIRDLPAIQREISALDSISLEAQNLENSGEITYRFSFIIDGREIELAHSGH